MNRGDQEGLRLYAKIVGGILVFIGMICISAAFGRLIGLETHQPDEGTAIGVGFALMVAGTFLVRELWK